MQDLNFFSFRCCYVHLTKTKNFSLCFSSYLFCNFIFQWVVLILLWAGVLSQVPPSGGGIFRYPLAEKLHDPARGSKSVIDDNFAPHAVNSSTTNITPETQSWSEGSNYTQLANVSQPEDRQGELAPVLVTAVPNNSLVENRQVEQQASSQPPEEMTTRPATMTTSSTTTVGPVSTTSTLRPMTVRIDHGGLETTTTELATITLNATPAKPEYCAPCDEELKNLTQTIKVSLQVF